MVAVVGRPNVGKSTLLNRLVGQKISITSARPQTTRHSIRGVLTGEDYQLVFVDTPGFQTRHASALNRAMNRSVVHSLRDIDLVFLVVEAGRFGAEDRAVLKLLPEGVPRIAVLNKIDRLARKELLLPFIESLAKEAAFDAIVPVSAEKGTGADELLKAARGRLPEGPPLFAPDEVTDRSERFLAAEFLREKLFRRLGEELPYGLTVEIERFEQEGSLRRIHAAVVVDKPGHKPIVIGKGGSLLKTIGSEARRDLERLFGGKVFLEVWVKVRSGWADSEQALKSLGYDE